MLCLLTFKEERFSLHINAENRKAELKIVEYIRTPSPYLDFVPPVKSHTNPYSAGAGKYPKRL